MLDDFAVAKVFGKPYSYYYNDNHPVQCLIRGDTYTGYEWDRKFYINELGKSIATVNIPNYHRTKLALPIEDPDLRTMITAVLVKLTDIEDRLDSLEHDRYSYD
jgi:hypothetical protein